MLSLAVKTVSTYLCFFFLQSGHIISYRRPGTLSLDPETLVFDLIHCDTYLKVSLDWTFCPVASHGVVWGWGWVESAARRLQCPASVCLAGVVVPCRWLIIRLASGILEPRAPTGASLQPPPHQTVTLGICQVHLKDNLQYLHTSRQTIAMHRPFHWKDLKLIKFLFSSVAKHAFLELALFKTISGHRSMFP